MTVRCNGCMSKCKWWRQRWENWQRKRTHPVRTIHSRIRTVALDRATTMCSHSREGRTLSRKSPSRPIPCSTVTSWCQEFARLNRLIIMCTLEERGITRSGLRAWVSLVSVWQITGRVFRIRAVIGSIRDSWLISVMTWSQESPLASPIKT